MNSMDRLFKEKLAEHQLTPRPQAWDKLEAQLAKKNKTILWIRLAAAVAVISLLTFILVNRETTVQPELVKTETPAVLPPAKDANALKKEELVAKTEVQSPKTNRVKPVQVQTEKAEVEQQVATIQNNETVAVAEPEENLESIVETEPAVAKVLEKKSIVLVYELPALKSKAAATEPVVVAGEEKQSNIQKILETAKDVKNSDNPWGDLREAKNELLAFDFKKDKNRNQ